MASMISPGVEVSITTDYSIAGQATTIPLIFIATADEKTQSDGETPALGTYEHNVYREITSIKQCVDTYGIPQYITDSDGNPHHGDSRNEYGLDALNKFLEVGNRAYVVRVNVNLDDRIHSIRELWDRKIKDAGEYLVQLIEDFIEQYNITNGHTKYDSYGNINPNYKETVTEAELLDLLDEALSEVADLYSFSTKDRTSGTNLFMEEFLVDHTVTTSAYQEIIFDTLPGLLTEDDTTSLDPDVDYSLTVTTNVDTDNVTFSGSNAQTFGDLLLAINNGLTKSSAKFHQGRIRFTADSDGATSTILVQNGNASGTEPFIERLSLYVGMSDPVNGRGADQLIIFDNGYDEEPSQNAGAYDGLYSMIADEGVIVSDKFTGSMAESLLLNAANQYSLTKEFRHHTALGVTDEERRSEIIVALKQAIKNPNLGLRNPDAFNYNLVACPGYPEVSEDLIGLARDMLEEVFVVGETPYDLPPLGHNGVVAWASSGKKESYEGIAYWYPHGLTSNIDGETILTTSAATALRVIAYNDREAELWYAPAGTDRGQCNHLSAIGYVSGTLGTPTAFIEDDIDLGTRDSLYEFPKNINPITYLTGRGHLVLGNKTTSPAVSPRESINVERLVRFIKREVRRGVFPYLFDPHDEITWANAKYTVDSFLSTLLDGRALYDFATICDESNNTSDRIDRKELWIDVAIKPVRAIEFIYVPIHVAHHGADIGNTIIG